MEKISKNSFANRCGGKLDFGLGSRNICLCIWPEELWAGSTNAGHVAGEPGAVCMVASGWLRCLVVEERVAFTVYTNERGCYPQFWISCFKAVFSLFSCYWVSGGTELLKDTFCLWTGSSQQCQCFVCTEHSDVWLSVGGSWCRALVTSPAAFLPLLICFEADEIIYRTPKCFRNNYGAKFLVLRDCLGSCDFGNMSVQNNCTVDLLIFNFHIFFLTSPHGVL